MQSDIPAKLLPKTLKQVIQFKRIKRLEINQFKNLPNLVSTIMFIRKYCPSMKFYNPEFVLKRGFHDEKTVRVRVYDYKDMKIDEFESVFMDADAILKRIMDCDAKGTMGATAEITTDTTSRLNEATSAAQ